MSVDDSSSTHREGAPAEKGAHAKGDPVVIDLGKKSRKQVKALRKGKAGKLMSQVDEAVETLRAQKAVADDAQVVIVVVREKSKRKGLLAL